MISIQIDDFLVGEEYSQLATGHQTGAIVTFVGRVRDFDTAPTTGMWLEHYPGMTEKVLGSILSQAKARWQVHQIRVIHRVGELAPGDQIVFVGVSSAHRQDAFSACEFVIDFLKTQAPFWKKEGQQWVEAKASDDVAAERWNDKN